jgi:D-mannonate dehydratase
MSFREELKQTWIEEMAYLESIKPDKEPDLYKAQLNRVNEIEKRLTDMEKTEIEVEEKAASRDIEEQIKYRQMDEEKKIQKSKNRIEIAKIAVPTTAAVIMGVIAMVYEKTDIMSSTTGKASWRDLIRFKI